MTVTTHSPALSLTWITDVAGLANLRGEWQALADRVQAEVFVQPDWVVTWWKYMGRGRKLACLVARNNGDLVGVLPFCVERFWQGLIPAKLARIAGTDPNCIILQLPLDPDFAASVLQAAVVDLTGRQGCLAVSFTPISERSAHAPLLMQMKDQAGLALSVEDAGQHIVFDLPDDFQTYHDALSKGRRDQYRRNVRNLGKAFEMTSDSVEPTATEFDHFVELHNAQWQAIGRGGHFVDWPGAEGLYREVTDRLSSQKLVQLDRLVGTVGPIAMELSLMTAERAHWRLPARIFDPEAQRQSAGTVVIVRMIERMIGDGIKMIEGGRGEYGYKLEFGGVPVPVHRMIAYQDTALSALRLKLLLAAADLLHFVYYRAWFLKFAPKVRQRLGMKPKPLWRSWIRTRF